MNDTPNPTTENTNLIINPPIGEFKTIYKTYEEVLVNKHYYARRLTFYRKLNKYYEIFLALGTSTVIAGWAIFQDNPGKTFWGIISGIVTILVILKPILQLSKDIEDYANLYSGYNALVVTLKPIVTEMSNLQGLTPQIIERFDAAEQQINELSLRDEVNPNEKIITRCKEAVAREIANMGFWYPPQIPAT